mmetsp:Transcript_34997/g.100794  ORF Transcript_34997/g.100794 Transcript_34997/m.100794 type:complete len:95 (+) Transcript_34997:649-933(+)
MLLGSALQFTVRTNMIMSFKMVFLPWKFMEFDIVFFIDFLVGTVENRRLDSFFIRRQRSRALLEKGFASSRKLTTSNLVEDLDKLLVVLTKDFI